MKTLDSIRQACVLLLAFSENRIGEERIQSLLNQLQSDETQSSQATRSAESEWSKGTWHDEQCEKVLGYDPDELSQLFADLLESSIAKIGPETASVLYQLKQDFEQEQRGTDETESIAPTIHHSLGPVGVASRVALPANSRFRLLRDHARGGLGQVWLARDEVLQRTVALKEIQNRYADDEGCRMRFLREATFTGRLEHPGIVPIYALGQFEDGRPFYAMRFIKGESLRSAIISFQERYQSSPRERFLGIEFRKLLGLFIDVCQAINYAHDQNVIHRDLKPDNIMIGEYGEALVVDWGLAKDVQNSTDRMQQAATDGKEVSPSHTLAGSVVGTPNYMSPEQAIGQGDKVGPASDIYGLGATLYFLLTGKPPYHGVPAKEILAEVKRGSYRKPRDLVEHLPLALNAICCKAMHPEVEERYQSARDLADDLERYLGDQPVAAFREPVGIRIRRWTRKRPRLTSTILATILVGGISSAIALGFISSKNRELTTVNSELVISNNNTLHARDEAQSLIKDYFLEVANADFLKIGTEDAETFRQRLLTKARDYYDQFLNDNQWPIDDAGQLEFANTYQLLADIELELGLANSALQRCTNGKAILEAIPQRSSVDQQRKRQLASLCATSSYANHSLGRRARSLDEIKRAVAILEEFVQSGNETGLDRHNIRRYRSALAERLVDMGRFQDAGQLLAESGKAIPDQPRSGMVSRPDQIDRLLVIQGQADVESSQGNHAQEIEILGEGIDLATRLADSNPDDPDFISYLANFQQNLALAYSKSGLLDKAEEALRKAITVREDMNNRKLGGAANVEYLGSAWRLDGQLRLRRGKSEEAIDSLNKSIEILEGTDSDRQISSRLARSLAESWFQLGELKASLGLIEAGLRDSARGLEIMKEVVELKDASTQDRLVYAMNLNNHAKLIGGSGYAEARLEFYKQAATIIEDVLDDAPDLLEIHKNRAIILGNFAATLNILYQFEDARNVMQKSIESAEYVCDRAKTFDARYRKAWNYNRYGAILVSLNDQSALEWFERSLNEWNDFPDDVRDDDRFISGYGGSLINGAGAFNSFGQTNNAMQLLDKADALLLPKLDSVEPNSLIARFYQNGQNVRRRVIRSQLQKLLEDQSSEIDWVQLIALSEEFLADINTPESDDLHLIARVLIHHGEEQRGKQFFERAIELATEESKLNLEREFRILFPDQ